eukprot:335728-Prorocentrum_lima.AAC.1
MAASAATLCAQRRHVARGGELFRELPGLVAHVADALRVDLHVRRQQLGQHAAPLLGRRAVFDQRHQAHPVALVEPGVALAGL